MERGLLATRQVLTEARNRIGRHPYDSIYRTLRDRCSTILESKPITETDWRQHYGQGLWEAALAAARDCQGRIFDLIICHHIDPNGAYRDRAIEELKSLAGWSTWIDPSHGGDIADLCTGECSATVAVALDWLAEDLSEADRLRCIHALRDKGIGPYNHAVEQQAWWYNCYHNWNAVINSGCGLAALLLSDEDPHAMKALSRAREGLKHFFDALGREGGWDEGVGYWAYAMRYLLMFGLALDHVRDERGIFHQRGMEATGQFGVYFSPRGHSASFGDSPSVPLYGMLYEFSRRYGTKEICWWLDRYALHRDPSTTGWSDAGLALLLRPTDLSALPEPDMAPVKIYNEIGWAAIADHWPEPNLYVALKTGDLSANHSHLDMNAVQVQVDGEMLLADIGNPPFSQSYYFTPERYSFYQAQAQAHNTVVVAQRDHRIDGQGSIVEGETHPRYRWVTGSAGAALGDTVRFSRHVIMTCRDLPRSPGQTVIVVDEITNAIREKVEANWHTFGKIALAGSSGTITGSQSLLHFRLGASAPVMCTTRENTLHRQTDSVLKIETQPVDRLILVSAFSRDPVGEIKLKQTSRGEAAIRLPGIRLHFKGSRRHLKLDQVQID